jgi:TonB family protein
MTKNNMFFIMLSLSAALHGLVLFRVAKNGFQPSSPVLANRFISTIKIIQTGTMPQKNAPIKHQEEVSVEKAIEATPETLPVQETYYSEETQEYEVVQESANAAGNNEQSHQDEGDTMNNGEIRKGESGSSEPVTDCEYEVLLAYIKEFINKNLVYPPIARQRNVQGVVGVYFEIGESGELVSVVVNHSSGSSILDNAAVSLIRKISPLRDIPIKRTLNLNIRIDYKLTE